MIEPLPEHNLYYIFWNGSRFGEEHPVKNTFIP